METINVAVIDDHQVVINGLAAMLASRHDVRIVYTTTDAEELQNYLSRNETDVLLMDIQMPGIGGIELCKLVLKKTPEVKIIAFSSFDDSHFVKQVMRNGASGYLLKNTDSETLVAAIQAVVNGEEYIDESIRKILLHESLKGQRRSIFDIPLTKREKEILKHVAEGLSNQEIADKLFISMRTVETHRLNLSQKLAAKNTASLVREAIKRGLID
ncbi:response regulator [Flavihumibacter solisilvae]|uniref:LuxR family transcriptional regulator n=1 Tax=Flavihumibacter solisilvae TaxID=1349421 RepID=A0A0C1L8Y6_9BACT|nr:response regulator transcription factor [Flavihumibacter solisilvae]KIC96001.1 LuxR family transcriptional regulator [Flavihumibacter solisilvae]